MDHNIKSELTEDGVLIARIDMPGRSMNVFSLDMMDSLERLLQHVEGSSGIRAVVLGSGKPTFLAGADLDMIRMFTERARSDSHDQLFDLCGRLGRLFRRLEKSTKPFVAAINGLALGGGLELSLACHARVVTDDKSVLLGLPEIKLGLLPGAGGTQRLPRLVGCCEGLRLLLIGEPLTPQQALALGVVDQVVAPEQLLVTALETARRIGGVVKPWDRPKASFDSAPFDFGRPDASRQVAESLELNAEQLNKYPAYQAIIDCVIGGWTKPMDDAGAWEMDIFVRLIQDPVAGNMVRTLFLNRQRADKVASANLDPRTTKLAVVGSDGAELQRQLEKGRATIVAAADLGAQDIALLMPGAGAERGIPVACLAGAEVARPQSARAAVWIAPTSPQGRCVEINAPADDAAARDAGLVLARWLRATPLVTHGPRALGPRLQTVQAQARDAALTDEQQLLAVALAAADVWGEGGIDDTELADVGIVLAGLFPSYTGGPFTYLRQCGRGDLEQRAAAFSPAAPAELFRVPAALGALTEKLASPARP